MIGGAVTLGVNTQNRQHGYISVQTYLVFISIQALGPFVAAPLSPPHKVLRADHTPVQVNLLKGLATELCAMRALLRRTEILLLLPMIFQSVFSEAFFSTYNATYFTVRSRALASLVASTGVVIANFALGFFLDWADDGFGRGVCIYILMLVGFNLMYDYLYWLIGTVNRTGGDIVRLGAVVRGVESAGQAISYGINPIKQARFPLSGAVAVNLSFFAACIIPSAFVVFRVGIIDGVKAYRVQQDEDRVGFEETGSESIGSMSGDIHHERIVKSDD